MVEWQQCLNGILRTTKKLNYFVTYTDQKRNIDQRRSESEKNHKSSDCSHNPASLHPTQVAMSQRVPPVRLKFF